MQDFEKAVELDNEVEARMLDAMLTERDIPHIMRSFHDRAYDGLFQATRGWGIVLAPPECLDEIAATLEEIRSGEEPPEALEP